MIKYLLVFGLIFGLVTFFVLYGIPKSFVATQEVVTSKVDHSLDTRTYSPISLEKIFDGKSEEVPATEKIVLLATGDVIPARAVNFQATQRKDFLWPYTLIAATTQNADLTFINLETPLMKNCVPTQSGMTFCGSDKHIEGLKLMGVDLASIANNHAGNYGRVGIDETLKLLNQAGIDVVGNADPVVKTVRGVRFAFFGFNDIGAAQDGINHTDDYHMAEEIKKYRDKADVIIVTFHWGTEYQAQPDQRQKELAHLTIDSGADLVIGNHPHWVQPVEIYKGKVIMYAHGNTIFDQEWSQETKRGVLGKYIFAGKQLVDIEYIPIGLKDYGQAFIAEDPLKSSILSKLKIESEKLNK